MKFIEVGGCRVNEEWARTLNQRFHANVCICKGRLDCAGGAAPTGVVEAAGWGVAASAAPVGATA